VIEFLLGNKEFEVDMSKELILVLDTNTNVHYKPFIEIDWCKMFVAKRIRLVIPLIV
jgi:hypothetical protein